MRCKSAHYNSTDDSTQATTMSYVAFSQPHKVKEPLLNAGTTAPLICELVSEWSYGKARTRMENITSLQLADATPHRKEGEGEASGMFQDTSDQGTREWCGPRVGTNRGCQSIHAGHDCTTVSS